MKEKKEAKLKKIYHRLMIDEKVKTQAEFGKVLKFNPTAISQMINGSKPMPFRLVKSLNKAFGVNANYIIVDDDGVPFYVNEMYSKEHIEAKAAADRLNQTVEGLQRELKDLRQRLQDKEEIISLLKKANP